MQVLRFSSIFVSFSNTNDMFIFVITFQQTLIIGLEMVIFFSFFLFWKPDCHFLLRGSFEWFYTVKYISKCYNSTDMTEQRKKLSSPYDLEGIMSKDIERHSK